MTYALDLTVTAVLLTNMIQFAHHRARGKNRKKALILLWSAFPLSLAMPAAIVVTEIGEVGAKLWVNSAWWPNTAQGIILFVCKYLGVILMIWGVCLTTNIHIKIRDRWRTLRGTHQIEPLEFDAPDVELKGALGGSDQKEDIVDL